MQRQIYLVIALLGAILSGCAADSSRGRAAVAAEYAGVSQEPWNFGPNKGTRMRTRHYEVFTTVADTRYNQRLAVTLEAALRQYQHIIGPAAPAPDTRPMQCYIFADRFQYEAYTKIKLGESAGEYLKFNRGGYSVGDVFASHYAGDGTIATAAHEGFHQYLARHFRDSLPPFLEEGIATMFEGVSWSSTGAPAWNLSRNQPLSEQLHAAAAAGALIPLATLARLDAGAVVEEGSTLPYQLFYAQSWAFARFMFEADGGRYRPALQRMFADAAAGRLYDPTGATTRPVGVFRPNEAAAVIERYLGRSLTEIEPQYRAYIREIARAPAVFE